jgi:hydroxymethylbilane synthase
MWQSEWVRDSLSRAWPDRRFEIVEIETTGDKVLDRPLPAIGGKGLFTEQLESALRAGDVDLAVHSLKDLPTDLAPGLRVGAVCEREDPRDAWVATADGARDLWAARRGARIGTGSERRRAQILAARPDVQVAAIRGNVETRLRKLDEGRYDALIMAAAGLLRLGLGRRISSYLEPPEWLSAPGQGAIAVESREDDPTIDQLVRPIDDDAARAETGAERALLARLQGGCQVPVGARAWARGTALILHGLIAAPDGSQLIRAHGEGRAERPEELGIQVAEEMLSRGGEVIVAAFRESGRGG